MFDKLLIKLFFKTEQSPTINGLITQTLFSILSMTSEDEEIKSKYMTYTEFDISIIFLPFVLVRDLYCFSYNTAITPYIALHYRENPLQYYYYIKIQLRRSMVTKNE